MIVLLVPVLVAVLWVALVRGRSATAPDRPGRAASFGPMLGGVAAVSLFLLVPVGFSGDGLGLAVVLGGIALLALAGLALTRRSTGRAALAERPWSAPAPTMSRPAVPRARAVALALGRVESRQLATGPWFGVGIGFCVLMIVLFGFVWAGEDSHTWVGAIQLTPWFAHPMVGLVVLAAHRCVTRAARDGADEIFDACPTAAETRTAGFLLSAATPLVTLAVFFAVLEIALTVRAPLLHGAIGADSVADVLAAVLLGAGGVALGVALGRWVRFGLAPLVAVVAIGFFITGVVNGSARGGWKPLAALSTAPTVNNLSPVFTDRPVWWHLLWLAGLTAVVAVVALARHRRDRAVAVAGALAAAVVLIAGIGATRPLPAGSAARIADRIASPEAHQNCRATTGRVDVCVFPFHRALLGPVTERVAPVAAALPAAAAPLVLRQRFDGDLGDLPPEVRRKLTEVDLAPRPGEVPLGFDQGSEVGDDPGFHLAFAALDLPTEANEEMLPAVLAGEARGVVALWLATRGLPAGDAARATTAELPGSPDAFDRGSLLAASACVVPAVVWSAQDLAAARALLALPESDVAGVISDGWARWADPRTGTDDLLAALGLPGVGPFDVVVARPGQPC
ncbi:MAG: hypothetical protein QOI86_3647 [Actinomycetota bacterium]|jgi:hypothetical protein|nr:hypothetical protein [Actinomycetota bacterium]